MDNLLQTLRSFEALRDQNDISQSDKVHIRKLDAIAPTYETSNTIDILHPLLREALDKINVPILYQHQADAMRLSLNGKDVVLESPTASGKTLAFALPMLNILLNDSSARAIMIQPLKALSNDQRRQIQNLTDFLRTRGRIIESWPYDGDTPQEHRKLIRNNPPAILITNPEMLHLSFLGASNSWGNYLRSIKYIIIDEIHEYRGYFGSHMALLIRRFLRKLHSLGNDPQLFMATATCANPKTHADNLTGRNVTLVSSNNKMRPCRELAFINPLSIPEFNYHEIYQLRVAMAALACMSKNMSTIVFCPSRKFAENVTNKARHQANRLGLSRSEIAPYRSGYSPADRRKIEDGLRSGDYKIIFSTNALELGIDIGRLDVCILAGFPDSIMSAWQRIGRAGRSFDKKAYVLYFAMNNAFDQFYAENIDAFLETPLDEIIIGLDNKELMDQHLKFLLNESQWGLNDTDKITLGEKFLQKAQDASQGRQMLNGAPPPNYQGLSLRGIADSTFKLICHGTEIGTISSVQAFHEAYIGSVYHHCSNSYRVTSHGAREIYLEECDSRLRSIPSFYTVINEAEIFKGKKYGDYLSLFHGKLNIFENFTGYRLEDEDGNLLNEIVTNSARRTTAHALWINIQAHTGNADSIRGLEQIFRIGSIFVIPSDRHDTTTFCNADNLTIYFYENVPGGIGLVEKAYDIWQTVLSEGMKIAKKCDCREGCPYCIHPPRLRNGQNVSKIGGLQLAQNILDSINGPTHAYDPNVHGWMAID